jgi:tetratricopeptide (TPR) repeat protein
MFLPVEKILDRLNDRFRLLTRGSSTVLPRHQTLRALIDWSYDLLNEKERTLLQRLSIFMGGWTYEGAEEICSDETIDEYEILDLQTSLESKSLINVTETDGVNRYNMLETIKEYCVEKFTDRTPTLKKHFEYHLKLSDYENVISKGVNQVEWVRSLDSELDNLRVAIQWALENDHANAYRMIYLLRHFWLIKAYFREGYQTCLKALAFNDVDDKQRRAQVLLTAAEMCFGLGHFPELEKFVNESLTLFREIDDKVGIAACLIQLGNLSYTNIEMKKANDYFEGALKISDEIGSKDLKAMSLRNLSFLVNQEDEAELALKMKEEALKIFREIKDSYNTASVLASLGVYEFQRGNFERANIFF